MEPAWRRAPGGTRHSRVARPRAAHGGRWAAGKANVDSCRDNAQRSPCMALHPLGGVAPWLAGRHAAPVVA